MDVAEIVSVSGDCMDLCSAENRSDSSALLKIDNKGSYYSTLAPFYHIRSRERAKYATVLHSKIMYCTVKSRFHRFSGRKIGKTKF